MDWIKAQPPEFWIAQVIAVIICVISAVSYFKKAKSGFLLLQVLVNILYCLQYALLGIWSGVIGNAITVVKFWSFRNDAARGVKTSLKKSVIFCVVSVVFGLFGIGDGWFALIPIICAVLITYATAQDNAVKLRICYTVANLLWIIYNFMGRAYVSSVYSAFELVVSLVAVFVFLKSAHERSDLPMSDAKTDQAQNE